MRSIVYRFAFSFNLSFIHLSIYHSKSREDYHRSQMKPSRNETAAAAIACRFVQVRSAGAALVQLLVHRSFAGSLLVFGPARSLSRAKQTERVTSRSRMLQAGITLGRSSGISRIHAVAVGAVAARQVFFKAGSSASAAARSRA